MGRLLAGVAHDFNNVLSVVVTLADLLRRARPESDPDRADLDEITAAARRGAEITRLLAGFGRTASGEEAEVPLASTLRGNEAILRRLLPAGARLQVAASDPEPVLRADPVEVDRLFVQLVVAAADVVPEGGTVRLAVARELSPPEGPAAAVALEVEGPDPAPTRRPRTPSLRAVREAAERLGGLVEVREGGPPLAVRVLLPCGPAEAAELPEVSVAGGSETLLLVDDDGAARGVLRRFLAGLGYVVVDAAGGDEARALIAHGGLRPDLVVADLESMGPRHEPGEGDGWAHEWEERLVYLSGVPGHPSVGRLRARGRMVLSKPVAPARLAGAVRARLDKVREGDR